MSNTKVIQCASVDEVYQYIMPHMNSMESTMWPEALYIDDIDAENGANDYED